MASGRNLAAAAGGWSARHRRKAIFGWLAFVVVAYLAGVAIGQRQLTNVQMGNGESKQATALLNRGFPYHSGEQVLIQGRGPIRVADAVFAAAVRDLVGRLESLRSVANIRSPLAAGNRALVSADGRSALVTFGVAGDSSQAQNNVGAVLRATRATAAAYPQLRVEESSARRAPTRR